MDALRIYGGKPLAGQVHISGAKNAALPMLAAALLTEDTLVLSRVPDLRDITSMLELLSILGVQASTMESRDHSAGKTLALKAATLVKMPPKAPYDLVRTMRASVLVLGPLLVRYGQAIVSLPGGCAIGARPVDQHLKALKALGANITVEEGYVHAHCRALRGAKIRFDMPTVGGTENALMAAAMAKGESVISNAAQEPEIPALATLLRAMGAKIEGDGTSTIYIQGQTTLHGANLPIIADRIETGTYLLAAAATRGKITVNDTDPAMIEILLQKLEEAGVQVNVDNQTITVDASQNTLRPIDIHTAPYPGFPTDLQAQWMSFLATIAGSAEVTEAIFENRFMHVPELQRMGADIRVHGPMAIVHGGKPLSGAPVMATDLRASAGLVIAALAAQGITEILRIYHLERGYEQLVEKLQKLGAQVERYARPA